jgi:hypothetical protein
MGKKARLWLVLTAIVVAALIATFWVAKYMPLRPPGAQRTPMSIPGDIEVYYSVKTLISTVNAAILIFLFISYIDIYIRTKSEFTVWLIIFSIILLLNALASNPLVHLIFGFHAFGLGPFAMLPDLFTLGALAVLLYMTVKY